MDSWTLQGDSYSFLRSTPRTFSLCHRDGTPNHVEIFDIINVPTQRSAISETTCLCDIFGDDCESPSLAQLPSSPAVGSFVPSQKEVEETAAAAPLVDDLNDSSGSYYTAPGSSEGEEGFEDSREKVHSPLLLSSSSERCQSDGERSSSQHTNFFEETSPDLEQKGKSPAPQLVEAYPPSKVLNIGESPPPSPVHNSSYPTSPGERLSPLSSPSIEKRYLLSSSSPNQTEAHSEAEIERITSISRDKHNSHLHHSLTPSPISEPRNSVRSSSSESLNIQSSSDFRVAQNSLEPGSSSFNQHSSPSPEPSSKDLSPDFAESLQESLFQSTGILSSPLPTEINSELSHKNRPYTPDTQALSPFSELRGRVSLPDLFSRGSTPDVEASPCSPELISRPSSGRRDTPSTPEGKNRSPVEPSSSISTPAPRYTTPSPVISTATSPGPVEITVSPEFGQTASSPGLLSAASPAETRTPSPSPSPKLKHISTTPENRTDSLTPVDSYSLSPLPELLSNHSPLERRHTVHSPEIKIIASSPELHTDSASSRSLTSSPHITGISYTVVQPEDWATPPFPEQSHLLTPEPDRAFVFTEASSPTQSRDSICSSVAESTGTPPGSPQISGLTSSDLQLEITSNQLSNQPRYQTPSPEPKHRTPSPEPRYQTSSPFQQQSPIPQQPTSRDPSPANPSPKENSPAILSAECCSEHTQPTTSSSSPEIKKYSSLVDITHNVSNSFKLERGDRSVIAENKNSLPLVPLVNLPIKTSPFSGKEKIESSPQQQSTERAVSPKRKKANILDNSGFASLSEEIKAFDHTHFEKEDSFNNTSIKIKSLSPTFIVTQDTGSTISPVHMAKPNSSLQNLGKTQPEFTTYSDGSESRSSLKSDSTPAQLRRHLPTQVRRESRERFTGNMGHDVNRRTPSPPLTRFTPVHIIAPEKPYRHWQNRGHSPSQVVTFSPKGNLNKVVTNRENPNVAPTDSNSQAQYIRLGGQLEMDREMEEERVVAKRKQSNRERERKRADWVPKKEKGWQGDANYREEQVELSFNARNRKGPLSCSAALTSRETHQGLPKVHSYSESLLATRQLQQQQSLLRLASQQDTRGGGPSRRLQHSAHQNKNKTLGRGASSRPCRSSSSSMGSELDEADDEVKWFTDLAFHSLSSPEVDYLDMYNSSHRSSTNISQPSTQESPAGVNSSWQAYADFRGSAPKLDNDEFSFEQLSTNYSVGLDPSRRYEMGSFECVDVALEREDSRRVRRGVPKRQILLKRKNNAEGKQDGSSENSSPAVMLESPSSETHTGEIVMRQQSTPATAQECFPSTSSPEPKQKNDRNLRLQKSLSLEDTGSKTKIATCLIKSVLSKKILSVDKEPGEEAEDVNPASEENCLPIKSVEPPFKVSPKPDTHKLTSIPQSDYGLSSESLPGRVEPSTKDETKSPKSFGLRFGNRPSSSSSSRSVSFSQSDSEEADAQSRKTTSLRSEIRSEIKVSFDSKQSRTGVQQGNDIKIWDETKDGDSANTAAGNTGASSATGASSSPARMTNREQECENTEDYKQLQLVDTTCTSKSQEIMIKAVEKKKASLSVRLTPEAENQPGIFSPDMFSRENEKRVEPIMEDRTGGDEENGNNKLKTPIHKVRDVRQLVKNKYNLSFKAPSTVMPSDANEFMTEGFSEQMRDTKEEKGKETTAEKEQEETQNMRIQERREETEEENRVEKEEEQKEEDDSKLITSLPSSQSKRTPLSRPHPMQIQYKAVCWKEDKNKKSNRIKEDPEEKSQVSSELVTEVSKESQKSKTTNTESYTTEDITHDKQNQHDLKMAADTKETVTDMHKMTDKEGKPVVVTTDRNAPVLGSLPRLPSKEREVSTAVVLVRDGSRQTKTSASPSQEDIPTPEIPSTSLSPGPMTNGNTLSNSGHSVSMFLKGKGYQADIGAVVGDAQNSTGGKGPLHKHINCLEIPVQTSVLSDDEQNESPRGNTFSSSSTMSHSSSVSENKDMLTTTEAEGVNNKPTIKDIVKQKGTPPLRNTPDQTPSLIKQKELGDFEAVKRLDPTFPPRSPAVRRFRPQSIEVKSLSKETQKQGIPSNSSGTNIPQTIEVKSVAKNSQKPVVPPKPNCKFKPADSGAMPNDAQKPLTSIIKPQGEERSQTIVVSSPTVYRKISNESTATSNYTRKLAVSAVSSFKPPPSKTTSSSLSLQPTAPSVPEAHNNREQQQPAASPKSSTYTQRTTTSAQASTTCVGLISASGSISDPVVSQITGSSTAAANQANQSAVTDPSSQPVHTRMACPHEQTTLVSSNNTNQPAPVPTTQMPSYTHQPYRRSLSGERLRRTDDLRFYASDDPPSYDERESFSPLMLPDLTPKKPIRYQPSSRPPPCSCSVGCPSHPGLSPSHHHRIPHNLTPPAPPHSPGQGMSYPVAQLPLRPHQCRLDPQPMSYQPSSPKSSPLGPNQPLALYQPLHQPFHQPPPCPPHPSLMQACTTDRPLQPPQHIDPRRPPVHRSPQQQPQSIAGAPYSDPGHSHSPGLPPVDPQYLCSPQNLGPSYGSEYGGDSSSLYSESNYGHTPRRVLLDPETGKYFYIEVPVQPLRKMLFDPETGQYVEVLIPQQAMSHSGLYPPSAAPYPPLHNPNMYASGTQYMPYAAPPPPAHNQTQPQPPRYPETSAEATIHSSGPGVSYRNPSGQGSKLEPQNRPPLDQSYLESMYYVPTGMNASPNPTPPDYYHKHPSSLPPTGGERS